MNSQPQTAIKPTVGRFVHYYEARPAEQHGSTGIFIAGPLAAQVTAVHSDTCVNVRISSADGARAYGRTSILLLQPGEHRPERGEWVEWMPAQVDHQAAVIRTQAAFEESKKLHDEISAHVFAERARLKAEAAGNLGDCNKIPPSQQELRK